MEKYNRIQKRVDFDITKMNLYSFFEVYDWGEDVFEDSEKFSYYLLLCDTHEGGGSIQFEKSENNTSDMIISEFNDEYDPSGYYGSDDFDNTNEVFTNEEGFMNIQLFELVSEKSPKLLYDRIKKFKSEMTEFDDFLGWLNEDNEFLGYESCELFIDSLGLNRQEDLGFLFEEKLLLQNFKDLLSNPKIISFGGYYQSGEFEMILGKVRK